MKQNILVKFNADWADEFDVDGFTVTTIEAWEKDVEKFKKAETYTGFYFGTNEGWDDDDIDESWLDNYKIKKLTKEEAKVIEKRLLKYGSFGVFPWPSELIEENEEEDYEEA